MEPRSWLMPERRLRLTCVRSHTSREIKNTTITEFNTFLKSSKSKEHFLTVNYFLPYLRLTVKIFQFLQLSAKFLAVLRLSVNPIGTLVVASRIEMSAFFEAIERML